MFNSNIKQFNEAINQGAYEIAYKLGSALVQSGNTSKEILTMTTLAQIASTNIDDLNLLSVSHNLSFALSNIYDDIGDVEELEGVFRNLIHLTNEVHQALKNNYLTVDEQLKKQYRGSTGFYLDSNDPTEKQRRERENENNNDINQKRHNLKTQYEAVKELIYNNILIAITTSKVFLNNKHKISLEFCADVEKTAKYANTETASLAKFFNEKVRHSRNEFYWTIHQDQYNAYKREIEENTNTVNHIISAKLGEAEQKNKMAIEEKNIAKKERKRYALFNRTDRKPLSEQIAKSRKIIKEETRKISELKNGICVECDPYRERIKTIENELSKQR